MKNLAIVTLAVVMCTTLVACKREESAAPANPSTVSTSSLPALPKLDPKATEAVVAAAKDWAGEAQKVYTDGMGYIADKKWDLAEKAINDLNGMKDNLPAEWAGKIASLKTAYDVGRNWSGEADLIYTQGLDYIKEKKWDLAEKALQDLTKMKPNLPVEWQLRVDEFKKAYDVAKAAKMLNDAKLPGM